MAEICGFLNPTYPCSKIYFVSLSEKSLQTLQCKICVVRRYEKDFKMTRFENVLIREKPYCVYHHEINGVVFYIGSGILARAFEQGFARRNEAWNAYVDINGPDVTVRIAHYCRERAEARRVEYDQIKTARPITNLPHDPSVPFEWQVLPLPDYGNVATDAYLGQAIRMEPDGKIFWNLTDAHRTTGISKSAICNSCSGRYPVVQGKQFTRVPKPR